MEVQRQLIICSHNAPHSLSRRTGIFLLNWYVLSISLYRHGQLDSTDSFPSADHHPSPHRHSYSASSPPDSILPNHMGTGLPVLDYNCHYTVPLCNLCRPVYGAFEVPQCQWSSVVLLAISAHRIWRQASLLGQSAYTPASSGLLHRLLCQRWASWPGVCAGMACAKASERL